MYSVCIIYGAFMKYWRYVKEEKYVCMWKTVASDSPSSSSWEGNLELSKLPEEMWETETEKEVTCEVCNM